MQEEGPLCCTGQEGGLQLLLPLLLSVGPCAEALCSLVPLWGITVKVGPDRARARGVFRQAGRGHCTTPQGREGIAEAGILRKLLQGCRAWDGSPSGWAARSS